MKPEQKTWYALYVKSRTERKVAVEFDYNKVEYYLPLVKRLKQWSDRKKMVEEPLFRGYVFVNINIKDYDKVVQTQNVVKFISFEGHAVPIPEAQINAIKLYLEDTESQALKDSILIEGQEVEVVSGDLTGLKGNLVEVKGRKKVKVQIETVNSSIIVSIPKSKLRIVGK